VTQNAERLTNDEETDAQAVALCGIRRGEGLEDPRNVLSRNFNARVEYIDPDHRTGMPTTKKDTTSFGNGLQQRLQAVPRRIDSKSAKLICRAWY